MPQAIIFKNDLKKSQTWNINNQMNSISQEEIFKIVLELFPQYSKNDEITLCYKSKTINYSEESKTKTIDLTQYSTFYVLRRTKGGNSE